MSVVSRVILESSLLSVELSWSHVQRLSGSFAICDGHEFNLLCVM